MNKTAIAIAHPNIAFIKYWGNRDPDLRLPENGSISMNLAELFTRTQVSFHLKNKKDQLSINSRVASENELERVVKFLNHVRHISEKKLYAKVVSENNFPTAVGIASSASAFAALSLAATQAIGLQLSEAEQSRLARLGSGSACRSIPSGFVEWYPGQNDRDSFARSFAPPEHWDLVDCIVIVQPEKKRVGSSEGHALAHTSPIQSSRVSDTPRRLEICRNAILKRDFSTLAEIIELDSNLMHAVMMTSSPPLFYWEQSSLIIMKTIRLWRQEGLPVCYTLDAGPNVHVLCTAEISIQVKKRLEQLPGVFEVLCANPGGGAFLIEK